MGLSLVSLSGSRSMVLNPTYMAVLFSKIVMVFPDRATVEISANRRVLFSGHLRKDSHDVSRVARVVRNQRNDDDQHI